MKKYYRKLTLLQNICLLVAIVMCAISDTVCGEKNDSDISVLGRSKNQYDKFTKPLLVPPGALYAFEELDKDELIQLSKTIKKSNKINGKRNKKRKKKDKHKLQSNGVIANNESFLCRIGSKVKYDVLENDLPKDGKLIITRIIKQPILGNVSIDSQNIVYTEIVDKIGIDTFTYEVKDLKTGLSSIGRVRVLVTTDWKNGNYNVGNDSNFFIPPAYKYKYKQKRNFYTFFRVGVKPIKNVLKGGQFTPEMAFPFANRGEGGRDTLPAGYIWNYPYDKYYAKGSPILTCGFGFRDLPINAKYIRKYMFDFDIESYTLSSKNHWRSFQKWGSTPEGGRSVWTGDVGFTLEDKDYHPVSLVRGKVKPNAYYKLTTYQGITGYFADRRTPEKVEAGESWHCIRVRIPLDYSLPKHGGRIKFSFDFWPFLKFMIDHKGWEAGFPIGGPIGNEVYSNPNLSSEDSRPAGETLVRRISHWVQSDLPPKKTIGIITLKPNSMFTVNLKDIFTLPMMRPRALGEPISHKWPQFNPKFEVRSDYDTTILKAKIEGHELILSSGNCTGTVKLTVRCYDKFHQWYDEKQFPVKIY